MSLRLRLLCCVAGFCGSGLFGQAVAAEQRPQFPRVAITSNMGWFNPSYNASGYQNDTDFAVYPLEYLDTDKDNKELGMRVLQNQQEEMAAWGWNVHAPDFLFFDESHIERHIGFMRSCMKAAELSGMKDFWIIPMMETKPEKRELTAKGLIRMIDELGSNPYWLRVDGRPAILFYAINDGLEDWQAIRAAVEKAGKHAFWIMELGGLQPALFGTFDAAKARPYAELFDGIYNFGASSLTQGANFAANARKLLADTRAGNYIGGTIWPAYLSERENNRNFISARHTAHVREVWENVLAAKPDFLEWSTWNDFHEHTTLACSYSALTSQMELGRRYLCRYWDQPLPEGAPGVPEAILSYRKCLYQGEPITFEFLPLPTRTGPTKGTVKITARDQSGAPLFEQTSPELNLAQLMPWNCELTAGVRREATRVIRISASITPAGGAEIRYANLPDIAVAVPVSYADQLFYTVPLHRLAGAERKVVLKVNGQTVPAVDCEGLRKVEYAIEGPGAEQAVLCAMRNGRMLRALSPLSVGGTDAVNPDENDASFRPKPLSQPQAAVNWRASETPAGEDYFAALVRFPDGKWAYTPSVWSLNALSDRDRLCASWVFAPVSKARDKVVDQSGNGRDLLLDKEKHKGLKFLTLPGNARALEFDGKTTLQAPTLAATYGPAAVEVLFQPAETEREQVLCYQRGAQAALHLDKDGYLVGRRLPELRQPENTFVEVRSLRKLEKGKMAHAVLSFDGRELVLYLDGAEQARKACRGSRSCEGFAIGGPLGGGEKITVPVDGLPENSYFRGQIVRMSLWAQPLEGQQVAQMFQRARIMPFFR